MFTNIQICNISDKLSYKEIEERIIKFKESCNHKLTNINEEYENIKDNQNIVKVLYNQNNNFITIFDSQYTFKSLKENKSYIRKLAKTLTLPVFSITNIENEHIVIEQYSFNKRIYDYLSIGNLHEEVVMLGFNDSEYFNNTEIWKDFFVGRNNIDKLDNVIKNSKNYDDKSYIIEEMFKLYGLNRNMSLYNGNNCNNDITIKVLYFDKIM